MIQEHRRLRSPQRFLVHRRNVSGDHLPTDIGKADPGLALAADQVVAADLELEVHGGEVAAHGQDLQSQAPFLDAGTRRTSHAMGVDLVEAVAVLVHRIANGVRAPPEGGVENGDALVDQGLLVAFEQGADFLDHFWLVGGEILHAASNARAAATSVASLPRGPMMERPTGKPSTSAPGMLTCGWPVSPPCAQRQVMRSRNGPSTANRWPRSGAGNGVVGRQRMVPGGSSQAMRAHASWRIRLAQPRSLSEIRAPITRPLATEKAKRGLRSSSQSLKVV